MTEVMKVYISKVDGSIHTDFSGFQGASCLNEANKLKEHLSKLGIDLTSKEFTPKQELTTQKEDEKHVIEH